MSTSFSVLTPSYNQGFFIERTIASVLSQSGVNFDYLICDGGSTDTSLSVISNYAAHIQWLSEIDDGQADAVNKGIAMTKGDVIGWLNSDDIYYSEALAKVARVFSNHPEIQIVYGQADWIDEYDNILKPFPTESWHYERLKETCFLCQPAVFFRRSLVEQYGALDKTLQYCMDYELWLRYGQHVEFYYLPEKLAGSRMYKTNKTMGQALSAHTEINAMLAQKFGRIHANWLLGYSLVKVEQQYGVSRYNRKQTYHFVARLVQLSFLELWRHNPAALAWVAPKMLFWFLLPDRAWFRREDILALVDLG